MCCTCEILFTMFLSWLSLTEIIIMSAVYWGSIHSCGCVHILYITIRNTPISFILLPWAGTHACLCLLVAKQPKCKITLHFVCICFCTFVTNQKAPFSTHIHTRVKPSVIMSGLGTEANPPRLVYKQVPCWICPSLILLIGDCIVLSMSLRWRPDHLPAR